MKQEKVYKILTIILVIQWALIQLLAMYPKLIESFYSNGLYKFISNILRFILGWVPFSIGDAFYFLLILFIFYSIFIFFRQKNYNIKNVFFKIVGLLSVIIFFFNLNWGLNYLRPPLTTTLQISNTPYSTSELINFTKALILKTNEIQQHITKNDTVVVSNPYKKKVLRAMAFNAYKQLAKKNSIFTYNNFSVKSSLFSVPLTYMGFAGYLNPFTNEAQVNYLIPKNAYPATVCHEMAHQIGIASESGANFVGYLAAINSKDYYFNYAGYLTALKYCLYELYNKNPKKYNLLKNTVNKGILKDIQQNQAFWRKYQNWSEKYFKNFYNLFLKVNKQKDGLKEYNKMVYLLINYYKSHKI
jgi:hypothetical protein